MSSLQLTSPLHATLLILFSPPIPSLRQALCTGDEKVYPWGVPPRVCCRSQYPHVIPLHQSHSPKASVKPVAHLVLAHSTLVYLAVLVGSKMASTLQSLVLYSVPIAVLFDLLKTLGHLPMGKECQRALFRRCTLEELRDLAKTLPWDHPVARKLDHEVHRRRMAGVSFCFFFHGQGVGPFLPLFIFIDS